MNSNNRLPVIIIGGGWAGLAAAVDLSRQGMPVHLIEAAKQLGGRTRRVLFADKAVDYGQHILFGSFRHTLELLETMSVHPSKVLKRYSFEFVHQYSATESLRFKLPSLPFPAQMLFGLGLLRGLSWKEKLSILGVFADIRNQKISTEADVSLHQTLTERHQSIKALELFWHPLCQMLLNTPIRDTSTMVFLDFVRNLFLQTRGDASLLIPPGELSRVIADPAADFIDLHGGKIQLGYQTSGLNVEAGVIKGVYLGNELVRGSHVVLTVPASSLPGLFAPVPALQEIVQQVKNLKYRTITQLYLKYPSKTFLPATYVFLPGPLAGFIVDKRYQGHPGVMAVSIDGNIETLGLTESELIQTVTRELARLFPHWEPPRQHLMVPVDDAAVLCETQINASRPPIHTTIEGLWLAGEYVAGESWLSLDNAIASGRKCAQKILETTRLNP